MRFWGRLRFLRNHWRQQHPQIELLWTFSSSANNKISWSGYGVTVYSATRTTSVKEAPLIVLANRNSLTSQIQPYDNAYVTAGSDTQQRDTINFANSVTVDITGQREQAMAMRLNSNTIECCISWGTRWQTGMFVLIQPIAECATDSPMILPGEAGLRLFGAVRAGWR